MDKFNDKAMKVKWHLKRFCIEKIFFLRDHTKTFDTRNINKSNLHLNKQELEFYPEIWLRLCQTFWTDMK